MTREKGLTIGSLFSGIGGLELGLERGIGEGCRTVWQVEQDEYCRAVLAKHWPDAQTFNDVKEVGAHNLSPVDLICGGFPCQDISYAGKGAGLAGARSGLWHEYARIVRELRPSYVVVENVAALLTRGVDAVLGTLASLGYDAEWDCISAASVGAPHIRDRLFILAHAAGLGCGQGRARRLAGTGEDRTLIPSPRLVTDADRGRRAQPDPEERQDRISDSHGDGGGADWWKDEPAVGRLAYGLSAGLARRSLTALGNAVVPQVAEVVGRLIAERESELRGVA